MFAPFILASSSPRRRELLGSLGLNFKVISAEVTETPLCGESPRDFVLRVAQEKAEIVGHRHPHEWILAADTAVVIDGVILGKPQDSTEAHHMLRRLSGREHLVITAYVVSCLGRRRISSGAEETRVKIKSLTDAEIDWYVRTDEPFDKAGAYAIQGHAAFMVEWISGSYTNVVGLPLCQVLDLLRHERVIEIF